MGAFSRAVQNGTMSLANELRRSGKPPGGVERHQIADHLILLQASLDAAEAERDALRAKLRHCKCGETKEGE